MVYGYGFGGGGSGGVEDVGGCGLVEVGGLGGERYVGEGYGGKRYRLGKWNVFVKG